MVLCLCSDRGVWGRQFWRWFSQRNGGARCTEAVWSHKPCHVRWALNFLQELIRVHLTRTTSTRLKTPDTVLAKALRSTEFYIKNKCKTVKARCWYMCAVRTRFFFLFLLPRTCSDHLKCCFCLIIFWHFC